MQNAVEDFSLAARIPSYTERAYAAIAAAAPVAKKPRAKRQRRFIVEKSLFNLGEWRHVATYPKLDAARKASPRRFWYEYRIRREDQTA